MSKLYTPRASACLKHMSHPSPSIKRQAGYFMIGVSIALICASLLAIGVARSSLTTFKENIGAGLGNQLQIVNNALIEYVSINQAALLANTNIAGVTTDLRPTVGELQALGLLNAAVQPVPTAGGAYVFTIARLPAGCQIGACIGLTAAVYLRDPIVAPDGRVADIRLLSAAMNASGTNQIGASMAANPAFITGIGWTVANPDAAQRAGILYANANLVIGAANAVQYWLKPSATFINLPTLGNADGDGRFALDTDKPYKWNSATASWVEVFSEPGYVSIGNGSGKTGGANTFVGTNAGTNNNGGNNNNFIGAFAGSANTTGNANIFTGASAGMSNTTGSNNIFTGAFAGNANTTGSGNIFMGLNAGLVNTTGMNNVFTGTAAGIANKTGSNNIFTGSNAGLRNSSGDQNIFIGTSAGQDNTTGSNNIFTGYAAGVANTTGKNNVFTGYAAGTANTTGANNIFTGSSAGAANIGGVGNIFTGLYAGKSNTTGTNNIFMGSEYYDPSPIVALTAAGAANTTGINNIFMGASAGAYNTSGSENIFMGIRAGLKSTGNSNTMIGHGAGNGVTSGFENVFIGNSAGFLELGSQNVYIGKGAGQSGWGSTFTNAIAIGFNTTTTASNTVRIGNSSMTLIGGQVGWSTASDRRLKTNIVNSERGLGFIRALRPVDYILKDSQKAETGFIAQEVEEVDASFPGVNKPASDQDFYSLAYTDFIPSMVKSIQELDRRTAETPRAIAAPELAGAMPWAWGLMAGLLALLGAMVAWCLNQNRVLRAQLLAIQAQLRMMGESR